MRTVEVTIGPGKRPVHWVRSRGRVGGKYAACGLPGALMGARLGRRAAHKLIDCERCWVLLCEAEGRRIAHEEQQGELF